MSDIIYTETGKMVPKEHLERKHKIKIPFTEYLRVKTAIPKRWLNILEGKEGTEEEEDYKLIDRLLDAEKPTPLVYRLLLNNIFEPLTPKAEKWNQDLDTNTDPEIYLGQLEKARTSTINKKLRSYNYNFYMRNVPYGSRLKKMGISQDSICKDCGNEESLLHLYWECPHSRRFWERLKEMVH